MAHVARPLCFAAGLDRTRYHVAIAAAHWAAPHVKAAGIEHVPLDSIEPRRFLAALAKGHAVYDSETLQRYVENDLELIKRFEPDLIVGDFRLSLSVSARLAKVPYATISSAYWSPHYVPPHWPVPALPFTRWLPIGLAQILFDEVRPLAFRLHSRPLNRLRNSYGLAPLARDLRRIYTDADFVLYSDLPQLFPLQDPPSSHRFLGPVLWEPICDLPSWWREMDQSRPSIYVTLGSSGERSLLQLVLEGLRELDAFVIAATAGRPFPRALPSNARCTDYVPGLQASKYARLVICNGGSLTAYQALSAGVPVIGIAGNLDQFLNMQGVERAGGGLTLRSDRFSSAAILRAVRRVMEEPLFANAANRLRVACNTSSFERRSGEFADEVLIGRTVKGDAGSR